MGVDIHLSVIRNEEYIKKEIFDGRNSEWFNNLQKRGHSEVYDLLPVNYGIPENIPEEIQKDYDEKIYYGFHYITVGDFIDWCYEYRPWINAGWVTTWEKWAYDNKRHTIYDAPIYKPEDASEPYYFIEYENTYDDCSKKLRDLLLDWLKDKEICRNDILIYYFDC